MVEIASGQMSLEGDLSRCKFADDLVIANEEIGLLKRNTIWPRQDFVVLRLEPDTIAPIFKQALAAGLKRAIIHVQIELAGMLQLGSYDNFYPGSVFTGPRVSGALLSELKSNRVLWDFAVAPASSG